MLALGSLAFASPWLLLALAGAADPLVAAAGDAAGAAPHRLSGAAAAAGAGAARGDAGADAAVADPAAHGAGGAGHRRAGPSAAQSAGAPRRDRAAGAGRSTMAGRRRGDWTAPQPRSPTCSPRPSARAATSCCSRPRPPAATRRRRRCRRCAPPMRAPRSTRCRRSRGRSIAGAALARLETLVSARRRRRVWLSDGIDDGAGRQGARGLSRRPRQRPLSDGADRRQAPLLLAAGDPDGQGSDRVVLRSLPAAEPRLEVRAIGDDGRLLGAAAASTLDAGRHVALSRACRCRASCATARPRIEIEGEASAGAVLLLDERWRRRPVGIVAPRATPRRAAAARAAPIISTGAWPRSARCAAARSRPAQAARSRCWLARCWRRLARPRRRDRQMDGRRRHGAALRRAASRRRSDDDLLPVTLRRGGRTHRRRAVVGEAGASRAVRAPAARSPGSTIPADVTVSRQVLAEPDARSRRQDLGAAHRRHAAGHRRKARAGAGSSWCTPRPNPEWSNLAISGLFVNMLRRDRRDEPGRARRAGEGRCRRSRRSTGSAGCSARRRRRARSPAGAFAATLASPQHPPGFYGTADARRALNSRAGMKNFAPIAGAAAGRRARELRARPARSISARRC